MMPGQNTSISQNLSDKVQKQMSAISGYLRETARIIGDFLRTKSTETFDYLVVRSYKTGSNLILKLFFFNEQQLSDPTSSIVNVINPVFLMGCLGGLCSGIGTTIWDSFCGIGISTCRACEIGFKFSYEETTDNDNGLKTWLYENSYGGYAFNVGRLVGIIPGLIFGSVAACFSVIGGASVRAVSFMQGIGNTCVQSFKYAYQKVKNDASKNADDTSNITEDDNYQYKGKHPLLYRYGRRLGYLPGIIFGVIGVSFGITYQVFVRTLAVVQAIEGTCKIGLLCGYELSTKIDTLQIDTNFNKKHPLSNIIGICIGSIPGMVLFVAGAFSRCIKETWNGASTIVTAAFDVALTVLKYIGSAGYDFLKL
ncbi:MAG: hypothetical protein CL816_04490 [Coxiellaceae bacterium]|nr:hypothetical protein [Coxiellaceae bacterium]|tara:strand:+ start:4407 stop:5507 length:1101 start_codon:yes stop_codon:yes gene_type:complete